MKRNKVHRFLAAALSVAMVFSLAACGGKNDSEGDKTEGDKTEGDENQKEDKEQNSGEVTELTYYSAWSGSTLDDAAWFTKILEDELGIKMEVALGTGDESVAQSMIASGELTDIFTLRGNPVYVQATTGNMLLNLDDYKDQLPNLYENPDFEAALKRTRSITGDGVYGIPTLIGEQSGLYLTPQISWEEYYQLGCPEIKSDDDLLNVLKQMQELRPENENGQKVYGIQLWNDWDGNGWLGWMNGLYANHRGFYSMGSFCGVAFDFSEEPFFSLEEGSPYLDALKFMFKANQMGVLDPESATQNYEQMVTKMNAGCGLYDGFGWYSFGDADAESPTGFAPFIADNSCEIINAARPAGYTWYFGISSKCENIDKALELLNWYCDPENQDLILNGPEGGIWEYNEDGIRVATEGYKAEDTNLQLEGGGTLKNVRDFWGTNMYNNSGYELGLGNGTQKNQINSDPAFNPKKDSAMETQWKSVYGEEWDWSNMQAYAESKGCAKQQTSYDMFLPAYTDDEIAKITEIANIILPLEWQAIFAADEAEFNALIEQARQDAAALGVDEIIQREIERYHAASEEAHSYGIE